MDGVQKTRQTLVGDKITRWRMTRPGKGSNDHGPEVRMTLRTTEEGSIIKKEAISDG